MKFKRSILAIISTLLSISPLFGADRYPAVAGSFYPGDSLGLYYMVDSMIQKANNIAIDGSPLAIISPHAGFVYSGPTAAYGYKLLSHYPEIKTAIVIGFKHRVDYSGVVVWSEGAWKTPLGDIEVDSALARQILMQSNIIRASTSYFAGEHSLEVQLPFLQVACSGIKIVPIQIGDQEDAIVNVLTDILAKTLKDRTDIILIASTDLSHYKERAECRRLDNFTASYIKNLDGSGLWDAARKNQAQLCGAAPVAIVLQTAKKLEADQVKILKQSDSGDFSGDTSQVVGYVSAVVYKSGDNSKIESNVEKQYIPDSDRTLLLKIARESIRAYVYGEEIPQFHIPVGVLTDKGAAFVTITIHGQLRGCIGYTEAILPLYETVSTCAIKAASEDPRFPLLTKSEYANIDLEISVLTPLQKIDDPTLVTVGKHGLMIQKGYSRGLLLPQVATDYGWDRETFLDQTCRKAGLPADCWKEGCDIYVFTAEVFGEE